MPQWVVPQCKTSKSRNVQPLISPCLGLEMNCYILDIHIECCFLAVRQWEDGIYFYEHNPVQVGPLYMML